MKIIVWVQHLLGTGHTVRTAALARVLAAAGADTSLILGATPPPTLDLSGLDMVQLPPVLATDASFKTLRGEAGLYADLAGTRRAAILKAVAGADVFITESYPFGRKPFAAELQAPLQAVRAAGGLTVASVRDILVRKDPARRAAMAETARRLVDHVIVHGDPALTGPEDTFHMPASDLPELHYTGYIHHAPSAEGADHHGAVVVTAGGSGVGEALYQCAIKAAAQLGPRAPWHLLVPRPLADRIADWQTAARPHVTVAPNRPDFARFLAGASVSVSQAGYNTVLDAIAAGPPMILVPFADGEETEQTDRARLFAREPGIAMLAAETLTPSALAEAVASALEGPRPALSLDMSGAERAAAKIMELAAR